MYGSDLMRRGYVELHSAVSDLTGVLTISVRRGKEASTMPLFDGFKVGVLVIQVQNKLY